MANMLVDMLYMAAAQRRLASWPACWKPASIWAKVKPQVPLRNCLQRYLRCVTCYLHVFTGLFGFVSQHIQCWYWAHFLCPQNIPFAKVLVHKSSLHASYLIVPALGSIHQPSVNPWSQICVLDSACPPCSSSNKR